MYLVGLVVVVLNEANQHFKDFVCHGSLSSRQSRESLIFTLLTLLQLEVVTVTVTLKWLMSSRCIEFPTIKTTKM